MAIRIVKDRQSRTDLTILSYGNQDRYFELHKENAELLVDNTKSIPELSIPGDFATGTTIQFDEKEVTKEVLRILSREILEVATQASFILGNSNLIMTAIEIKEDIDEVLSPGADPSAEELNILLTKMLNFSEGIRVAMLAAKVIRKQVQFENSEYQDDLLNDTTKEQLSLMWDGQDIISGSPDAVVAGNSLRINPNYGDITAYLTIYPKIEEE